MTAVRMIGERSRKSRKIFVSYAHPDREIARRIASELRKSGLTVWFDEWEMMHGDSIIERIDRAVSTSDFLIVLLSRSSVDSRWVQSELNAALARELQSRAITVLPVLIEDCIIPARLADKSYLDLRKDFERGLEHLVQRLSVAPEIDFTQLTPAEFEELTANILNLLGFSVEAQNSLEDRGVDIIAKLSTKDPFGARQQETWLVQTKLYRDQRVSINTLRNMLGTLASLPASHQGLIVTNSQLTSVAREFLAEEAVQLRAGLRVVDGSELTQLLLQHPELVRQYFGQGADE